MGYHECDARGGDVDLNLYFACKGRAEGGSYHIVDGSAK